MARPRKPLLPDDARHGTTNGYRNLRCRCDRCRAAATKDKQMWQAVRASLSPDDPRHGSLNAYQNYGCRCAACTEVQRVGHLKSRGKGQAGGAT